MAEAMYRKYRSRRLDDVVGQEHITNTLRNALKSGRISHAYLLTGPRGVGKTSVARILAHEVNGLPYKEDAEHLDIIEIDAASNRRIDEIRDLRDKVHITPTSAKYKVYIIDEVHMLTKEAFNALLKTLEEPPEHAIFILATTEAHKLPDTIISRTQRFTFRPIDAEAAVKHLRSLAKSEKINIDDEALKLIAQHATGSFRDSISMLDQLSSSGKKVTSKEVLGMLGVVPEESVKGLAICTESGSAKELLDSLEDLRLKGYTAAQIAKQLGSYFRDQTVNDGSIEIIDLLKKLLDVPASHEPEQLLELLLVEYNLNNSSQEHIPKEVKQEDSSGPVEEVKPPRPKTKSSLDDETWESILADVKAQHNTLYSIVRMAKPNMNKNKLTLSFDFPFHQKRISEDKNMAALSKIAKSHLGEKVTIECVVSEKPKEPAKHENSENVKNISNIFGGAEVLDS